MAAFLRSLMLPTDPPATPTDSYVPEVKVVVGDEKVEFILPESELARIPSFHACLSDSTDVRVAKLPNEEPDTVEAVLHWLLSGKIDGIPLNKDRKVREPCEKKRELELAKLNVFATKYNIEGLANSVVDKFIVHSESRLVSPSIISEMTNAGYQDSLLRHYLVRRLAYNIVVDEAAVSYWKERPSRKKPERKWELFLTRNPQFKDEIAGLSTDDVFELLRQCSQILPMEDRTAYADRCHWHQHDYTHKCSPKDKKPEGPHVELIVRRLGQKKGATTITAEVSSDTSATSSVTPSNEMSEDCTAVSPGIMENSSEAPSNNLPRETSSTVATTERRELSEKDAEPRVSG